MNQAPIPIMGTHNGPAVPQEIKTQPIVDPETGKVECPLCGTKVAVLETRGKNVGCKPCLDKITSPIRNLVYNVGRNAPCPCGSKDANGKSIKFKKCCGKQN